MRSRRTGQLGSLSPASTATDRSRCAGLLGHIAEEIRNPIANSIFHAVESNADYVEPSA